MKVFNGKTFLDENSIEIELSNGFKAVVRDIQQNVIDEFTKVDENSEVRLVDVAAKVLSCDVVALNNIGAVELKGMISFLFENLFK